MMEIRLFRIPSSSRLLLLSAICSLTNALPHSVPNPTASYKAADWNPRPTTAPRSRVELLRRDTSNASICGWSGGNVNQPVACPSDAKCVYDTTHGMVGCCPLSGACTTGVYTTCIEGAQGAQNPSILTCSAGSVCYQNTFPGGYYQYACGASAVTNTIATSYSGQNWASQLQIIYTQLTLATTQSTSSTSSTVSSTTTSSTVSSTSTTSSPSSSSASSSTTSTNTFSTTASTISQTPTSSSSPIGAQSVGNTTVAMAAATGLDPQAKAGIIAGSVVGGVGVIFAIIALGCGLMRRRRRMRSEERTRSIVPKEKTMSISSYASSQLSGHTRLHPFSPDDIVSPMTPPQQPPMPSAQTTEVPDTLEEVQPVVELDNLYKRQPQLVDTPNPQPLPNVEEPYVRRVQLVDRPSIDELVDLPPPWVRAPTPPPRSPKRLMTKTLPPKDHTPLEVYLQSQITPIRPSVSVKSNTSDTSRYSRTTDGRSIRSFGDNRNGGSKEDEIPPMPVMRKPVGSGWYRTMAPVTERKSTDHVAFQLSNDEDKGRSLTSTQQTLERSISEPVRNSVTEEALERYAGMSATICNVQELDITGMASDWVAPLRLGAGASNSVAVKKQRSSPVPILGIPAAPPPGERENRLYDVRR